MGKSCRVPFCGQKYRSRKESPDVRFHEFPSNLPLREKWITAIRRKDFAPKDTDTVCSLHFEETDFFSNLKILRLRPNAVPSIFPGFPKYLQAKTKKDRRMINRATPDEIASRKRTYIKSRRKKALETPEEKMEEDQEVEYEVIQLGDSGHTISRAPKMQDASTQADGLWDKIQELFKANRQLRNELLKSNAAVKGLTCENKELRKEVKVLKSQGIKKEKKINQAGVSLSPKKVLPKPTKTLVAKKNDLYSYLNPRIPRCLYAPKGPKAWSPKQPKMILSVNHLNQVVVSQNQLPSGKGTQVLGTSIWHQTTDANLLDQSSKKLSPNVGSSEGDSNEKDTNVDDDLPIGVNDSVYSVHEIENETPSNLEENFILVPENCIIENHNGEVIIFANELDDKNVVEQGDI